MLPRSTSPHKGWKYSRPGRLEPKSFVNEVTNGEKLARGLMQEKQHKQVCLWVYTSQQGNLDLQFEYNIILVNSLH